MGTRDITILRSTLSLAERTRISAELRTLADLLQAGRGEAEMSLEIERDTTSMGLGELSRRYQISATTLAVIPGRIDPDAPMLPAGVRLLPGTGTAGVRFGECHSAFGDNPREFRPITRHPLTED